MSDDITLRVVPCPFCKAGARASWDESDGSALVACPSCGKHHRLRAWHDESDGEMPDEVLDRAIIEWRRLGPPPATAPRVFLGMPGYGELTAGAARGFWRSTRLPDDQVRYEYREGSLLAANFNALWCSALNLAANGMAPAYFAMQHADVEPSDWWLDTLIAELEARDLDIIGAAVPIKSPEGLTSLALARPDGDPWRPLARLTMREVHRLPPTFTSEDVGAPLLLNTGLWCCRFDPAWARKVHFAIHDRIVQDPNGRYVSQTEPEDWYFSRLLHELNLRVGATRKVRLTHRGPVAFPGDRPWGQAFDSEYATASPIPEAGRDGFRFPRDVDGWLTYDEGRALFELAKGRRVLEVGSYCGRSTICLAQAAHSVVAVDPHDGRGTPEPKDTREELETNLGRYGLTANVRIVEAAFACVRIEGPRRYDLTPIDDGRRYRATAAEGFGKLLRYDLIFIDGAHDYESVRSDIGHALELLAPGGLLAFHDYRAHPGEADGRWDPGVTQAVNELLESGGALLSRHYSLAVVRPPALIPVPCTQEV